MAGADLLVETQPDNIAWLLNVRGSDVPMNPVPHSFLLLDTEGGAEWFVDARKLGNDLDLSAVTVLDTDRFPDRARQATAGKSALIDADFAPAAVRSWIEAAGGRVIAQPDPVTLAKALKTATELSGYRDCHLEDGAALTDFLAWLATEAPRREAEGRPLTELDAERRLHSFRAERSGFLEDSFRTISAAGENAAMCHYAASPATDAAILSERPYLIDSGGQYANGTTDVTRTLMLGRPDDAMRDAYTAVLKGFLSLLTARFPRGTRGHQLDAFARRALWDIGLDYDHGTGHSVGHNLLIHEHPYRFAKQANDFGLEPGAIMTIEPGYYAEGRFGMRIENQVEVVADTHPGYCRFASLTLAPIDLSMVRPEALTADETRALDGYHAEVRERLSALVRPEARDFLAERTRPLSEQT
jgi:Xaa-Pro aminopeptidase